MTPSEDEKTHLTADLTGGDDAYAGLRDASATQEDKQEALNRLSSCGIDLDTLINAAQVPPDAGPYAAALQRIQGRIPDGWGRWISHDAGWYPIVVTCDESLAAMDPGYIGTKSKKSSARCGITARPAASRAPSCGRRSTTSPVRPSMRRPSLANAAVNRARYTTPTTLSKRSAPHARKRSAMRRRGGSTTTTGKAERLGSTGSTVSHH